MLYLANRLFQMVFIVTALSVVLFGLLSAMPGNPVDMLITSNPRIKHEDVIRLRKLRGLDQPWFVQYYRWLWGYYDPYRPPVVSLIDPLNVELDTQGQAMVVIDLSHALEDANAKSPSRLTVQGILGSSVNGLTVQQTFSEVGEHRVFFAVKEPHGLETVASVAVTVGKPTNQASLLIAPINSQIVDKPETFAVDLMPSIVDPQHTLTQPLHFELLEGSPGKIDEKGVYRNLFKNPGQSAIRFRVSDAAGHSNVGAFSVEHGPIPNTHRFNRGFIYVFTGDTAAMGFSNAYKRPVWELFAGPQQSFEEELARMKGRFFQRMTHTITGWIVSSGAIGNTIQLMLPAILLSLLIALPIGIISAVKQYSWLDYIVNFLAFVGISLPVFWFAIMVMFVFAENWQLFPAGGIQSPGIQEAGLWSVFTNRLEHAVLPTVVLSIAYTGRWLRYMRSSMLEVLPLDFVRTARAKGLSERVVILKHACRNALIPVVTVLTLSIPALFGGAVLTETVFSWPGIGRLEYNAVMNSDYYVAIVVFLISAVLVMLGNLLADVVYVMVDPRIRNG